MTEKIKIGIIKADKEKKKKGRKRGRLTEKSKPAIIKAKSGGTEEKEKAEPLDGKKRNLYNEANK